MNVSDGKCRPQPARLKVCPDYLVLQREEFIFPDDDDGYPIDNKVRRAIYIVAIARERDQAKMMKKNDSTTYVTYEYMPKMRAFRRPIGLTRI